MKKVLVSRLLLFSIAVAVLLIVCYLYSIHWGILLIAMPVVFVLSFKDFKGPYAAAIMNHGISDRPEQYPLPQLVCHTELFERFLTMLRRAGFVSLSIDEFYAYKQGKLPRKKKYVLLTFDDGYLDNWVFAAPLLKKHGMKGVMYVSQDFIEKSDRVRTRFDEIDYDPQRASALDCLNYCSEKELQLMDKEGVIQVEAHAKSHSFYFSSNQLVGYYKQTEVDPFVEWNAYPADKPFWMTDTTRKIPVGAPIFEHKPSCGNTSRYLPDPVAEQKISAYLQQVRDSQAGFDQQIVDDIMAQHPGRFETPEESDARFHAELVGVKEWLESLLGRPVNYMAWPHGGISKKGVELAKKHYRFFQIPNSGISNKPSDPVYRMSRIGGLGLRGTPFQQRMMVLKIRSKMEMACGNYYWILPFVLLKFLEKMKISTKADYQKPEHYYYNFKLVTP